MSTKVLIVDEAAGVRSLFTRILRSMDCETVEVFDGGAALEMLEDNDFDAAIFDMDTPLLSGIELLQAVRTSSRYSMLPVVMITDGSDHNKVTEAVRHGASECLTRPFDVEIVRARLQRVIKVAPRSARKSTAAPQTGGAMPSALIVDRNAEFRHFVANVLTSTYSTMQAEDAVQALRLCVLRPQSVLVLGDETGLLAPHALARRLKRNPDLADMRVVLVTPKGAASDIVDPAAFDAILTRTFVPAEFAQQFQQALAASPAGAASVVDDVRRSVASAMEQVLGMMASASVALVDDGSAAPPPELEAFTVMTLQAQGVDMRLALRCDLPSARRLGALMTGLQESEIAVEDAQSGLGEIVNVIGGRVKAAVTRAGESVSYTIPETRSIDRSAADPANDVTLHFASTDGQLSLRVVLTTLGAGAPAAVGAAEACVTSAADPRS